MPVTPQAASITQQGHGFSADEAEKKHVIVRSASIQICMHEQSCGDDG